MLPALISHCTGVPSLLRDYLLSSHEESKFEELLVKSVLFLFKSQIGLLVLSCGLENNPCNCWERDYGVLVDKADKHAVVAKESSLYSSFSCSIVSILRCF